MRNIKTLEELLTVQYATINNLYSYNGKTYKGSVLQADKDIKKFLKAGWVAQIPFDVKPRSKRQQYFYYVTRKGAKAIDREEDFKQKFTKALNNAEHESAKIDIALSFVRNFPDYEFDFNYKADLDKLRPDILIKAKNADGKEFHFLVEIERKKDLSRVYREKLQKYNKHIKAGLFKKNNLSPNTRVLFVLTTTKFDVYLRPNQYADYKSQLVSLYKQFDSFMSSVKKESNKHFRFLIFPEFQFLPNCLVPTGEKVKIL